MIEYSIYTTHARFSTSAEDDDTLSIAARCSSVRLPYQSLSVSLLRSLRVRLRRLALIDSPIAILFYMTVVQLPLGLVPGIPVWVCPSAVLWPWVGVVGLTGLSAHYCMARALKLADATVVVPMDFMRLPLIALVGFLFYGEVLEFWVFIGAAFICAGV